MIERLQEIEAKHGVSVELLCEALEEALQVGYRSHDVDSDVRVAVDRSTASITLHRRRRVVEHVADPKREIVRTSAPPAYEPGDFIDEPIDVADLGRAAVLMASRLLGRRVLQFRMNRVFDEYRARQGTIVTGLVQRTIGGATYVVFEDGSEACLTPSERAPRDSFAINDRLTAELYRVRKSASYPILILSRSRASFVRGLVGSPYVLAGARRAGAVTYLASSADLDPEIVASVREKIGERIEVIRWSHDPAALVAQIMPPDTSDVFALPEHRLLIIESANPATPLQIDLAQQLSGWNVATAELGKSDDVLEGVLVEIAAAQKPIDGDEPDPELVRKLEEFARERAEDAGGDLL